MNLTAESPAARTALQDESDPDPPPVEADGMSRALLESRQRWRQFGTIASDLVFETDASGMLTFLAPEHVLGWQVSQLLGRPAHTLLTEQDPTDPFLFTMPQHRRHTWLRTRAGGSLCLALTIIPMRDETGRHRGVRGVGVNVTEQELAASANAAALRRGDVLDHILTEMRQEVMAPKMMQSVLSALSRALGAQGVAVMDLADPVPAAGAAILHATGSGAVGRLQAIVPILQASEEPTNTFCLEHGMPVLASCCSTRFGDRAAVVAWRPPGGRNWDADDRVLAGSVSGLVRIVLEHETIQRELARQARTDPLTGLLNRRAFMEEATRRLDRLERDGVPGTLLFLDLDRLKQLNDTQGHDVGDAALLIVSSLLHRTFRPADLVARLGGDEFAVWMDGADSLTAAERAEDLRLAAPIEMAHLARAATEGPSLSTGIATREPGTDETLEQLIHRADHAMYEVKRSGRGHWLVAGLGAST